MTVAVAVLAALVVLLTVLLVVERRRSSRSRHEAEAQLERSRQEQAELRTRLEETATRAEAAERLHADTEKLLTEADDERQDRAARLVAVEAERDELAGRVARVEQDAQRLRDRLAAAGAGQTATEHEDALWALELARSERTWRHSVAPLPLGPSPFEDTADPLRLAVEVEAAALREEVGAPLEVRWDATVTDPSRSLLVLRLAQELLASAARGSHAAVLEIRGSDEVVLHLSGEDDEPVEVDAPRVPEGLVSIEDGDGVRIVVHPA